MGEVGVIMCRRRTKAMLLGGERWWWRAGRDWVGGVRGGGWMRRLLSIMSGTARSEKRSDIKMRSFGH